MRLDHESLSSPETDILRYHEYIYLLNSPYSIKLTLALNSVKNYFLYYFALYCLVYYILCLGR